MKNIQNCRNSMNAGRPPDSLEILTTNEISDENDNKQNEDLDEFLETYDMMLQNAEQFMKDSTDCRSRDNILTIDTSIVRDCGSSKCGSSLIITPKINNDANIFLSHEVHEPSELIGNEEPQNMNVDFNSLYNLIIQTFTRTTIEDECKEDIYIYYWELE